MPHLLYTVSAPMTTDEDLIAAAARGDEAAASEVFSRNFPRAHRIAFRVTRDADLAEDCAQAALARITERAAQFETSGTFQGYLYRVVVNEAKNALKSRARRVRHEERAARARPSRVDFAGDATILAEEVNAALGDLDDDLRLPIVLHYYEGLTQAEVAESLGVPAGTAASRIRRGLEKLEAQLASIALATVSIGSIEDALRAGGQAPVPAPRSTALRRTVRGAKATSVGIAAKVAASLVALAIAGTAVGIVIERRSGATVPLEAVTADPPAAISTTSVTEQPPEVTPAPVRTSTPSSVADRETTVPKTGALLASGRVLALGKPAPGMSIRIEVAETAFVATSDADGRFEVPGTPSAKEDGLLWVEARDPSRRFLGARTLVAEGSKKATLTLEPGALVSGRVVDAVTKEPLEGVRLTADKVGLAFGSIMVLEEEDAVSAKDGAFTIGPLREGDVRVVARAAGHAPARTKPVTLAAGKTAEVSLELGEGYALSGLVLDPEGKPVENAVLGLYLGSPREALVTPESWVDTECSGKSLEKVLGRSFDPDPEKKKRSILGEDAVFATTDALGRFRFEHLPKGKRQLICAHARFATSHTFVRSQDGEETTVRLEKGARIQGFARWKDGTLAAGALAVAMSQLGGGRFGVIDDAGRFAIEGLESGTYMLMATDPGLKAVPHMDDMKMVEVAAPSTTLCDIGPAPAGTRVVGHARKGGEPVKLGGATLRSSGSEKAVSVALLDDEGKFTFEGVAAGRYTLVASEGLGGGAHSVSVDVPEGAGEIVCDVDLLLGAIKGRVEGEGKGGIAVATAAATGEEHVGVVWLDGTFAIEGLPAGEYRVRAARGGVGTADSGPLSLAASACLENVALSVGTGGSPLEVEVVDQDGDPCSGAHAVLAPAGQAPVLASGLLADASGVEPGVVKLAKVPEGRWDVWAFADGRAASVTRDVAPGAKVTVKLSAAASLRVTATDESGKPVPGAFLSLHDGEGRALCPSPQGAKEGQVAPTGADGVASATLLPAGKLAVTVRSRDGKTATAEVVLEAGHEAQVSLVLK